MSLLGKRLATEIVDLVDSDDHLHQLVSKIKKKEKIALLRQELDDQEIRLMDQEIIDLYQLSDRYHNFDDIFSDLVNGQKIMAIHDEDKQYIIKKHDNNLNIEILMLNKYGFTLSITIVDTILFQDKSFSFFPSPHERDNRYKCSVRSYYRCQ